MLNQPNKRKRPTRIDDVTWQLFVKACGGCCCVCGRDAKLQQGHIQSHTDGGLLVFENLIPLCKPCNSKYKDSVTPDRRPDDWRNAFWKLMLAENHVGIVVPTRKSHVDTTLGNQAGETNGFIDLKDVEFVPRIHYITHTADTRPRLTESQARKLVREAVQKSKDCGIRPKRPIRKRQDEMVRLTMRPNGAEDFRIAVKEFLLEEPWVLDAKREIIQADSWQHICESYEDFVVDGRERTAQLEKQAAADREIYRVMDEESRIRERERRWEEYLRVVTLPSWPGMPEGDAEFIAAAAAEKDGLIQDVTDERLLASRDVVRRYKGHKEGELHKEKETLYAMLRQVVEWSREASLEQQIEIGEFLEFHRGWIDRARTVEGVEEQAWKVHEFHAEANPFGPRSEDSDFISAEEYEQDT